MRLFVIYFKSILYDPTNVSPRLIYILQITTIEWHNLIVPLLLDGLIKNMIVQLELYVEKPIWMRIVPKYLL